MSDKKEKLEHDPKETQENTPDVSSNKEKKEHDEDNTTATTEIKLADLEKDIDQMIASSENKSDKKKLEKMKKELEEKKDDQEFLSKKAKELKEMKEDQTIVDENPSLMKRLRYGTLIGGIAGKIGGDFGKHVKEWSEKKMKEKSKHSEKKSVMAKVGNAVLITSTILFVKKFFAKGREWLTNKDRKEDKEEQNNKETKTNPENKEEENKPVENKPVDAPEQSTVPEKNTNNPEENPSIGTEAATNEQEPPLKAGELQSIEHAKEEEKNMQEQGVSSLYILSRMIALGYVPSRVYKWRLANAILEKPWNMKVSLMKLIPSMRENLIRERAYLLANGVSQYDYDTHLNKLEAIHQDIKTGKITTLEQLKQAYPDMVDAKPRTIEKLLKNKKKPLDRAGHETEKKLDNLKSKEEQLRALDNDMKKLQKEAADKYESLKKLDAEAAKDPAKKKQLVEELNKITNEYNTKAAQVSAETGFTLKGLSDPEIVRYQRQFSSVDFLVKSNGGTSKFIEKANARGGKFMLSVGLAGLMFRAGSDVASQGILSKETALDAADFAASMVPFAGGCYDMGVAFKGKDLNGRELSTGDRWVRGVVGGVSLVLDCLGVVSFGAGNGASAGLKAGVKGVQATAKVVETAAKTTKAAETVVKTTENISKGISTGEKIYQGAKFAGHAVMFGGLCYGVVINAYDIVVSTNELGKPVVETVKARSTANTTIN